MSQVGMNPFDIRNLVDILINNISTSMLKS